MSVDNRRTVRAKSNGDSAPREIRRRPKNRRAQIAAAAASAFGSLGYHGVSMEDIASGLGISSAALYRHYPSKYALFREELLRVGRAMTESVHLPEDAAGAGPEHRLRQVLDALITATIDNRASVTLVRWEGRYLEPEDSDLLTEQQATVLDALGAELHALRPELDEDDLRVLRAAMLSTITSIADHHAALPAKSLTRLLSSACWDIAQAELPAVGDAVEPAAAAEIPDSFKHELLLRKAVELFHDRGYPNVSVEDIATAAGLSAASAVYRFYRGKSDLLAAAFRRAAERVSSAIGPAVASADSAEAALVSLIDQYVAGSFTERALTFVYYTEFQHVPAEERTVLRNIQRLSVEEWARLVREVRPELAPAESRFLVHAAFALVVDLGRSFGTAPIASQGRVAALMQIVLFGRRGQA
ncbi:TetR/AcrR family transcriptional regulator [Nocardia cyriacigeorgica]|uniref:TetR/AcrR family transcriptional regulator n=1 Tax=Nocardia cyriacigeorgica TaxID=135487 RepID=UPI0018931F61|nr:TetR/AcrR family transcriptional regulator [Nocardia cyriacigeorgica]MBF6161534.1 TetR/AcrR family transcriptional regulator [Nocardia cyriacigeorgica]MBF6200333.1 TetR/AcrR family transcriptional regulator [Nocardia cyriacigeorgica]MBF6316251.1 TetR/AcrR family transcriptional regulator [Nocardia cyriacigeorgica]MBF6342203.1 TetR/AcrR family transcriptional regulator [Nocardia cyriacigeorgica]MBF6512833.1 TetR/AcrR family transcriptional regulator [Nocardia cyriacigeorgica]